MGRNLMFGIGHEPDDVAIVNGLRIELPTEEHPRGRTSDVAISDLVDRPFRGFGELTVFEGTMNWFVASEFAGAIERVPLEPDWGTRAVPFGDVLLVAGNGGLVSIDAAGSRRVALPRPLSSIAVPAGVLRLEVEPGILLEWATLTEPPRVIGRLEGSAWSLDDSNEREPATRPERSRLAIPLPPPIPRVPSHTLGDRGPVRPVVRRLDEGRPPHRPRDAMALYLHGRAVGSLRDEVAPPDADVAADPRASLANALVQAMEVAYFEDGAIVRFDDEVRRYGRRGDLELVVPRSPAQSLIAHGVDARRFALLGTAVPATAVVIDGDRVETLDVPPDLFGTTHAELRVAVVLDDELLVVTWTSTVSSGPRQEPVERELEITRVALRGDTRGTVRRCPLELVERTSGPSFESRFGPVLRPSSDGSVALVVREDEEKRLLTIRHAGAIDTRPIDRELVQVRFADGRHGLGLFGATLDIRPTDDAARTFGPTIASAYDLLSEPLGSPTDVECDARRCEVGFAVYGHAEDVDASPAWQPHVGDWGHGAICPQERENTPQDLAVCNRRFEQLAAGTAQVQAAGDPPHDRVEPVFDARRRIELFPVPTVLGPRLFGRRRWEDRLFVAIGERAERPTSRPTTTFALAPQRGSVGPAVYRDELGVLARRNDRFDFFGLRGTHIGPYPSRPVDFTCTGADREPDAIQIVVRGSEDPISDRGEGSGCCGSDEPDWRDALVHYAVTHDRICLVSLERTKAGVTMRIAPSTSGPEASFVVRGVPVAGGCEP